jgi:hypothetical protein
VQEKVAPSANALKRYCMWVILMVVGCMSVAIGVSSAIVSGAVANPDLEPITA